MSVSEPEADTEYSRAGRGSEGRRRGPRARPDAVAIAVLCGGLAGAVLLLVAEFTPLLQVHSSARTAGVVTTIGTGSHHSYALVPVALLVAALTVTARASRSRLALTAIGLLGLVTLGIALLGDLPDAQATGLIARAGTYVAAASTPSVGLYLETLGGLVLLLTTAAGLLLAPQGPKAPAQTISSPRRSAS
jgi:hypothetical protein